MAPTDCFDCIYNLHMHHQLTFDQKGLTTIKKYRIMKCSYRWINNTIQIQRLFNPTPLNKMFYVTYSLLHIWCYSNHSRIAFTTSALHILQRHNPPNLNSPPFLIISLKDAFLFWQHEFDIVSWFQLNYHKTETPNCSKL